MGAKKGLLKGDKFNGRHSTVIQDAEPFITFVKGLDSVKKITIGVIKPSSAPKVRVKFVKEEHAIRMQVTGRSAVQTFYLYGDNLANLLADLEAVYE